MPSDKEAEGSLKNLIASTPLEDREKLLRMGLLLIETGTIKMAKEYKRRELTGDESNDLDMRFTYHPPTDTLKAKTYVELKGMGRELAAYICSTQEQSRERSLAITKLEEAIMWANAGIARNT